MNDPANPAGREPAAARPRRRLRPREIALGRRLPGESSPRPIPAFPIGPGRTAYSPQARGALAIVLVVLVALTVFIGVLLATGHGGSGARVVTIPAADRGASPALLRAAELVGFQPRTTPGAGQIENAPLFTANPGSSPSLLRVGTLAPLFTLRTPTGERVSLRRLRGHVVLLEFFATWCPHCAAEAPHLERLSASLPRSRFSFLGINADGETAPSVLAYHIFFGLGFPALLDPSRHPGSFSARGSAGPVSKAFRAGTFPTFYVLDRAGRVVWAGQGEQPDLLLRRELHRALAAPVR